MAMNRYWWDSFDKTLLNRKKIMKTFKVKIHGKNLLLNIDGDLKKYGFDATKFVKAENPKDAEKIAIILIRQNPNLRNTVFNEYADRLSINLEEIKEVNFLKFLAEKSTAGFKFYPEDEE